MRILTKIIQRLFSTPARPGGSTLGVRAGGSTPGMRPVGSNLGMRAVACEPPAPFDLLQASQGLLQFAHAGAAVVDTQGQVAYLNAAFERMSGVTLIEAAGRPLSGLLGLQSYASQEHVSLPIAEVLSQGRPYPLPFDAALIRRGLAPLPVEGNIAPVVDPAGDVVGALLLVVDASKTRQLVEQLAHQASHDGLTGLINRREFERRVRQALDSAHAYRGPHVLCLLGLDQFKGVNDACGREAGDVLLRQVAGLLQSRLRTRDALARMEGDEFGLLLENCALTEAEGIGNQLIEAVKAHRFTWQHQSFTLGASIGMIALSADTLDLASALSSVELACQAAKAKGRNRVQIYRPQDQELSMRKKEARRVMHISSALSANRFILLLQPIAPIAARRGEGEQFEVLTRMLGEDNKPLAPAEFIPTAERYNLMPELDRWVIRQAFTAYRQLYAGKSASARQTWAINVSGKSLVSAGFIDFIREQSTLYEVPPRSICFEITESAALAHVPKAEDCIWDLKKDGFRFSLDDFGRGNSSFSFLKNLPLDYLKIDGQLVRTICDDPVSLGMVDAVNRISQLLGLHSIAESVENEAILAQLKHLGVSYGQGYAIGRPAALDLRTKVHSLTERRLERIAGAGGRPPAGGGPDPTRSPPSG